MGFIITKDNIHTTDEKQWDMKGKEYNNYKGGKHKFRVSDDDNNIYFYGLSDCDSNFDPVDMFQNSYGCCHIEYRNEKTKKYEYL